MLPVPKGTVLYSRPRDPNGFGALYWVATQPALQLITGLQQLIGHVERVTEMVEMLDAVTKNTASEETKSIIQEDCIAFEDVSIVTPTGVQLVDKLSFRLDKGDSLLM